MRRRNLVAASWAIGLILAGGRVASVVAQPTAPGAKHTVAVDAFGGADLTEGAASADSLVALLTDALVDDGRFIVVERAGLGSIQTEQQLGQQGAATAATAAKTSHLIGASLLVRGAVTKFNAAAGGDGVQVSGAPAGGLLGFGGGVKNKRTTLAISLRLIDTTTGQIVATANAEGSATAREANAGLLNPGTGASVGTNSFRSTAVGKAAEDAIRAAVGKLAQHLADVP